MSYWIAGMLTAADVPVLSGTGTCSVPAGTVGREQFENPGRSCGRADVMAAVAWGALRSGPGMACWRRGRR